MVCAISCIMFCFGWPEHVVRAKKQECKIYFTVSTEIIYSFWMGNAIECRTITNNVSFTHENIREE